MSAIASQIISLTVVYSTVYLGADQRKHQSSALLAFVWGIHRDRIKGGQLRWKCFHLMTSSWTVFLDRGSQPPATFQWCGRKQNANTSLCFITSVNLWNSLVPNNVRKKSHDVQHCVNPWPHVQATQRMRVMPRWIISCDIKKLALKRLRTRQSHSPVICWRRPSNIWTN